MYAKLHSGSSAAMEIKYRKILHLKTVNTLKHVLWFPQFLFFPSISNHHCRYIFFPGVYVCISRIHKQAQKKTLKYEKVNWEEDTRRMRRRGRDENYENWNLMFYCYCKRRCNLSLIFHFAYEWGSEYDWASFLVRRRCREWVLNLWL